MNLYAKKTPGALERSEGQKGGKTVELIDTGYG